MRKIKKLTTKQETPKNSQHSKIYKTFSTELVSDTEAKQLFKDAKQVVQCNIKGVVDEARTIILKISTQNPDRSNDIVVSQGVNLDHYKNNPVVAGFHNYNKPAVGRAVEVGVGADYVVSKMEFTPEGDNPEADVLHDLYKKGFQNAASIGFMPLEAQPNENGGYIYNKWELYEYSLVLVPDNAEALTIMRSKGFDPDKIIEEQNAFEGIEEKGAISYKKTPLADKGEAWDAGEEVKAATVDDLKVMCTWVDSENKDNKSAYKLPHHKASGEHAVVWNGVKAAGGAVQGARGGVDIPEGDIAKVKAHLAKHYKEFDETPPWENKEDDDKDDDKEDDGKAINNSKVETKDLPDGDEDNKENPDYNEDTPITDLTVGELIDVIDRCLDAEEEENEDEDDDGDGKSAQEVVTKDVTQVLYLANILDTISWVIYVFEQTEVSQSTLDKLNQALGLILQVVQEQAQLGTKAVDFSKFPITKDSVKAIAKAGRSLSGDNEDKLQKACDHMGQAMDHVKDVLKTVNDDDDEDGKGDGNDDGDKDDDNDAKGDAKIPDTTDQNPGDEDKSAKSGFLKKAA